MNKVLLTILIMLGIAGFGWLVFLSPLFGMITLIICTVLGVFFFIYTGITDSRDFSNHIKDLKELEDEGRIEIDWESYNPITETFDIKHIK